MKIPSLIPKPGIEYLVPLRTSESGSPLFCFPGSGGNVSIFREMVAALREDNPVYGIDLEWLCERRADFTVELIAEFFLSVIRTRQPSGPYYLCGYSFGGLVAYEMARRLNSGGHDVGLVALLDAPNPALMKTLTQAASAEFRKAYLIDRLRKYFLHLQRGELRSFTNRGLAFATSRVGQLFMPIVKRAFQALNRSLPVSLKSNDPGFLRAWNSYQPKSYGGDIACFRVEERGPEHASDPSMGWNFCVKGKTHVHVVPGGHVNMMTAPAVVEIAERLASYLDRPRQKR